MAANLEVSKRSGHEDLCTSQGEVQTLGRCPPSLPPYCPAKEGAKVRGSPDEWPVVGAATGYSNIPDAPGGSWRTQSCGL